jgi:two-component system response regulator PilR (NtrC family)
MGLRIRETAETIEVHLDPQEKESQMQKPWRVLVVSSHMECRKSLLQILDTLPIDVITCATLEEAEEVLGRQPFELVFCDEYLPDGSFHDLIAGRENGHKRPLIAVLIRAGDWGDYVTAVRLGAFEAIRYPFHATDVELVIIRATHELEKRAFYSTTAG